VRVDDRHLDVDGTVAFGVFAALAESAASMGTGVGVAPATVASGMSNDTTVFASPSSGEMTVEARPRSRSEALWAWDVECHDSAGTQCALATVLVAVRPIPAG